MAADLSVGNEERETKNDGLEGAQALLDGIIGTFSDTESQMKADQSSPKHTLSVDKAKRTMSSESSSPSADDDFKGSYPESDKVDDDREERNTAFSEGLDVMDGASVLDHPPMTDRAADEERGGNVDSEQSQDRYFVVNNGGRFVIRTVHGDAANDDTQRAVHAEEQGHGQTSQRAVDRGPEDFSSVSTHDSMPSLLTDMESDDDSADFDNLSPESALSEEYGPDVRDDQVDEGHDAEDGNVQHIAYEIAQNESDTDSIGTQSE